jgi:murein DD-endopeptidase MepM/ murein hydrolase activator NlpD
MSSLDKRLFEKREFARVVHLPSDYHVFDLSSGPMVMPEGQKYAVGKYNELRPDIYNAEQFKNADNPELIRNIHIGVDIFGPRNTPIHSFDDGVVFSRACNHLELDYGYTLIVEYQIEGNKFYALYGHLSKASFEHNPPGRAISKGEEFAWMGDVHENGGWTPHLHLQLCTEQPDVCDMPGVVCQQDITKMLERYPDPRFVLGNLY